MIARVIAGRVVVEIGDATLVTMPLAEAIRFRASLDNAIWFTTQGVAEHDTLAELIQQMGAHE